MNLQRALLVFLIFISCVCFHKTACAEEKTDLHQVLVARLNGLVFTKMRPESIDEKEGVHIQDVDVPDPVAFKRVMQSYIGGPISLDVLNQVRQTALEFFQERGFLFSVVYVPVGQDISDGIVQVVIQRGRLGQVKVEGAKHFSKELCASYISTRPGEILEDDMMWRDLLYLNRNPYRTVDVFYEPGELVGETDVVLNVRDRFPVRAYAGYENTGNKVAGHNRLTAGLNFGNVFNRDHEFNYQFVTAPNLDRWHMHALSYIAPIYCRSQLKFFWNHVQSRPKSARDFTMRGRSWNLSGYYVAQVGRGLLGFGYDFTRTNNFLTFNADAVYDKQIDLSRFRLEYENRYDKPNRMIFYKVALVGSPGRMTAFNTTTLFQQERTGTQASYMYGTGQLRVTQDLARNMTWVLDSRLELSWLKLLPSEALSMGGAFSIRGYEENTLAADRGLIIRNEIRSPEWDFTRNKKRTNVLQFLLFTDIGLANGVNKTIVNKQSAFMWSIGPGLRYRFRTNIEARFDFGYQITRFKQVGRGRGRRYFPHLGLHGSF